ncbi:MAG: PaaI family thioesterase [Ectothiorhodospiraceae bacterium]|nr:PaaI family thioesterase [Ectothiorhodospiraceae bacterium]
MTETHPFAGWEVASGDPFEVHNGPLYWTLDAQGRGRCGFVVERRHCNCLGAVHGGMLMLLADYALFIIARHRLGQDTALTVSLNGDFTAPALEGDAVHADGEVLHATGRMLFVRGRMYTNANPVLGFSGVIRRVRQAPR